MRSYSCRERVRIQNNNFKHFLSSRGLRECRSKVVNYCLQNGLRTTCASVPPLSYRTPIESAGGSVSHNNCGGPVAIWRKCKNINTESIGLVITSLHTHYTKKPDLNLSKVRKSQITGYPSNTWREQNIVPEWLQRRPRLSPTRLEINKVLMNRLTSIGCSEIHLYLPRTTMK